MLWGVTIGFHHNVSLMGGAFELGALITINSFAISPTILLNSFIVSDNVYESKP